MSGRSFVLRDPLPIWVNLNPNPIDIPNLLASLQLTTYVDPVSRVPTFANAPKYQDPPHVLSERIAEVSIIVEFSLVCIVLKLGPYSKRLNVI